MVFLQERRRFPRYFAPEQFTAIGEFPPQRQYHLKIKDIGIDGLGFITDANLSRETVFRLFLEGTTKDGRAEQINTLATITWYVYDRNTSLYTAGAHFLGLKESDKQLLQNFLETLDVKSGG